MQQNDKKPEELGCIIWEGHPALLPYLLVARRMLGMTLVTIGIFCYLKFTWFLVTQVWGVFYILCLVGAIGSWLKIRYYIIDDMCVVRMGHTNYCMSFKTIHSTQFRILSNPIEILLGCRTIQYGKSYGYHSSKGSNTNLWRDTARFWCIRDYKKVEQLCKKISHKSI